jgi:hypothetical protein
MDTTDEIMAMVISETETEMKFFEAYHDLYGYTC